MPISNQTKSLDATIVKPTVAKTSIVSSNYRLSRTISKWVVYFCYTRSTFKTSWSCFLQGTSNHSVLTNLEKLFSICWVPEVLVSDNGLSFTSHEFWTNENRKKYYINQLWPQANEQEERFILSLFKIAKTALLEKLLS